MVAALHAARGCAGGLHRRQKHRDEHTDDGDHHQQLDERKSGSFHASILSQHRKIKMKTITATGKLVAANPWIKRKGCDDSPIPRKTAAPIMRKIVRVRTKSQ